MGWNYLSIYKLQVISPENLLGMWLLVHAGIKFNPHP